MVGTLHRAGRSAPFAHSDGAAILVGQLLARCLYLTRWPPFRKKGTGFILWLTSQEGQRLKYGLDNSLGLSKTDLYSGAVPANRAVAQALRKDPNWKQALATLDVPTRPDGSSPVFSKAYQVLADMQARIILKNANVTAELKAAQQQVQKLLDQGIKANPTLYKE